MKRKDGIIENIDEHLDVMAKFTKDESRAYLIKKREGNTKYNSQLIRYIKDANKKKSHQHHNNLNSQYLMFAEKYLDNLLG